MTALRIFRTNIIKKILLKLIINLTLVLMIPPTTVVEEIIQNVAKILSVNYETAFNLISEAVNSEDSSNELIDLLGFESMDLIFKIVENVKSFHKKISNFSKVNTEKNFILKEDNDLKEENLFYIEHKIEKIPSILIDKKDLKSVKLVKNYSNYFSYQYFNPVQSKVFDQIYYKDANMLVCAPTGSGKTDIALLGMLRAIEKCEGEDNSESKIVYIVPMKALATQITRKYSCIFGKDAVIEYTGDTKLPFDIVNNAKIVICTPEKFDVATRRLNCVFKKIDLVIIDEIHLLDDHRGAVIESIVSRMYRVAEKQQQHIRIVGLSATLPNYKDIGNFIRAKNVFYLGDDYRPVPLEIKLVGFKKNSKIDHEIDYLVEKINSFYSINKQSIVFVTSRNKTVALAKKLQTELNWSGNNNNIGVKNKASFFIKELAKHKIGIHHAGLSRTDRLYMEDLFIKKKIFVLISTATLAWGVNLPAYGVFIYKTEYYNPSLGKVDDLSILDILQIFGRAGRPQYDSEGFAFLITEAKKLPQYLGYLKKAREIESNLLYCLVDNLLGEIYLGNIYGYSEAIEWIKSTFLYQRILKKPKYYGLIKENQDDHREELMDYVSEGIKRLKELGMIEKTNNFSCTWLGAICTFFYVSHITAKRWIEEFPTIFDEFSLVYVLLRSQEFDSMLVRNDDLGVLEKIYEDLLLECIITGEYEESVEYKHYLLLQAFINHKDCHLNTSLKNDLNYLLDNLERLITAFREICLNYKKYTIYLLAVEFFDKIRRIEKVKRNLWTVKAKRINNYIEINVEFKETDNKCISTVVVNHNDKFTYKEIIKKIEKLSVEESTTDIKKDDDDVVVVQKRKTDEEMIIDLFEYRSKCQRFVKFIDDGSTNFNISIFNENFIFDYTVTIEIEETLSGFLKLGIHKCNLIESPVYLKSNNFNSSCDKHNILLHRKQYDPGLIEFYSVDNFMFNEKLVQMTHFISKKLISEIIEFKDSFEILCYNNEDVKNTIRNLNIHLAINYPKVLLSQSFSTKKDSKFTIFNKENVKVISSIKDKKRGNDYQGSIKKDLVIFKGLLCYENKEIIDMQSLFKYCQNNYKCIILESSNIIKYLIEEIF